MTSKLSEVVKAWKEGNHAFNSKGDQRYDGSVLRRLCGGMCNQYHLADYATTVAPLNEMLRKEWSLSWREDQVTEAAKMALAMNSRGN